MLLMLTIAWMEFKLLTRRSAYWLFVAGMAAITFYLGTAAPTGSNGADIQILVLSNSIFLALALVTWLVIPGVLRNISSGRDWYWATAVEGPFALMAQFLGQYLGLLAGMMTAWLLGCLAVMGQGQLTASALLSGYSQMLIWGSPALLLVQMVPFVVAALSRRLLVTIAISIALYLALVFGALTPFATPLALGNITLLTTRMDPLAGVGPEAPLLFWSAICYAACALGGITACAWLLSRLDPRYVLKPRSEFLIMLIALAAITTAVSTGIYHGHVAAARFVPSAPTGVLPDQWRVMSSRTQLKIGETTLSGTILFELQTITTTSVVAMVANTGLETERVMINGQVAQATRQGEFLLIPVPNTAPVSKGSGLTIAIDYRGGLVLLREDYQSASHLGMSGASGPPAEMARPLGGYLSQQATFLRRDGDWRPWPLSSAPHQSGDDKIRLEWNSPVAPLAHSGENLTSSGGLEIIWSSPIPDLLLAGGASEVHQGPSATLLVPAGSTADIRRGLSLIEHYRVLRKIAGLSEAPLTAAVLPWSQHVSLADGLIGYPAEAWVIGGPTQPLRFADPSQADFGLRLALTRTFLAEIMACRAPRLVLRVATNGARAQVEGTRWVRPDFSTPVCEALAIVLTAQAGFSSDNPEPLLASVIADWQKYTHLQMTVHTGFGPGPRGLMPPGVSPIEMRDTARWVVRLATTSRESKGIALIHLLQRLSQDYPANGDRIVTDQVLEELLKQGVSDPWK